MRSKEQREEQALVKRINRRLPFGSYLTKSRGRGAKYVLRSSNSFVVNGAVDIYRLADHFNVPLPRAIVEARNAERKAYTELRDNLARVRLDDDAVLGQDEILRLHLACQGVGGFTLPDGLREIPDMIEALIKVRQFKAAYQAEHIDPVLKWFARILDLHVREVRAEKEAA